MAKCALLSVVGVVSCLNPFVTTITSGAAGSSTSSSSWSTYLGNPARSSYKSPSTTMFSSKNIANLTPRWQTQVGASISAQPIVSDGVVYWGSWDGYERATSTSGETLWNTYLGRSPKTQCRGSTGVASTPTVADTQMGHEFRRLVFVGGGDTAVYALDASTGTIVWRTRLGKPGEGFVWASPVIFGRSVFIGLASVGDCPLVRGKLVKLDAATGQIQDSFYTMPKGCIGAGIWGSPTLDTESETLYFTTGNGDACAGKPSYSESIVEVRCANLQPVGSWSVPSLEQGWDTDFGTTPTLFTATHEGKQYRLVGAVNKNGIYYALVRNKLAAGPVWQIRSGVGGSRPPAGTGEIAPSAWDGKDLYLGSGKTSLNSTSCDGSVREVNPDSGKAIWADCLPAPVLAAPTVVGNMVAVGSGSHLLMLSRSTGAVLFDHNQPGDYFWSPVAVDASTMYIGDMKGHLYFASTTGAG